LINGKRIVVVLPAYNAEKTLEATVRELPELVDERILVDDHSGDETVAMARRLNLTVEVHDKNRGYGANQKNLLRQSPGQRRRRGGDDPSGLPVFRRCW